MTIQTHPNQQYAAINWLAVMGSAIERGDERAMWNAVYQHHDQEEAHKRLSDLVPRMAYTVDNAKVRRVELFLVPVVCGQDHPILADEAAWNLYGTCVGETVHTWFQLPHRMHTFSGVRPYDWVGGWRPAVLREHLLSVMPGVQKPRLEFDAAWLHLPPGAPRLGFIMVAVTSAKDFVQLPAETSARDARFRAVIAGLFQTREGESPATVLRPDHVQHAISSGLRAWLDELHRTIQITGWTVTPHPKHIDVVKVTLALASVEVPLMQFPIRKHQAGLGGITEVLSHLAALAPMLDRPMDVPEALPTRVALDLT